MLEATWKGSLMNSLLRRAGHGHEGRGRPEHYSSHYGTTARASRYRSADSLNCRQASSLVLLLSTQHDTDELEPTVAAGEAAGLSFHNPSPGELEMIAKLMKMETTDHVDNAGAWQPGRRS